MFVLFQVEEYAVVNGFHFSVNAGACNDLQRSILVNPFLSVGSGRQREYIILDPLKDGLPWFLP